VQLAASRLPMVALITKTAIFVSFNLQHADACASIATARKFLIRMAVLDHNIA
jgi:hypothetical protein